METSAGAQSKASNKKDLQYIEFCLNLEYFLNEKRVPLILNYFLLAYFPIY